MRARATTLYAERALLPEGWRRDVTLVIDAEGRIATAVPNTNPAPQAERAAILLPAAANLHSHAFQRGMAGLGETRSGSADSFWTWRDVMYRFVMALSPQDVEAISAFAFMEMLEAGFAAVGEFHYLHHQPDGARYANPAEMAERVAVAAADTGIGLTLLPVLYSYGGCDGRPVEGGQRRFASTPDKFENLVSGARNAVASLHDANVGVAPHSLRAVDGNGIAAARALAAGAPIHIHAAEQTREVEEMLSVRGARPIEWLLENADVDEKWCVVHATHMSQEETRALARSGATAGLCPMTEASLGDGTFPAAHYHAAGGRFGIGTDSHIAISLASELRQLETSQRLRDRARAVLAEPSRSNGRVLYEAALSGGSAACQRSGGAIAEGQLADLIALDAAHPDFAGRDGDALVDALIFSGTHNKVATVWSAGRQVVTEGRHIHREEIVERYKKTLNTLIPQL